MKGFLKNYTYIILCKKSKEAVIIDPGSLSFCIRLKLKKICSFLSKNNISLKYIINTHRHADHISGSRYLKKKLGAEILNYTYGLREGDQITFGRESLSVIETPGHSLDGICLHGNNHLFTGDTLFVGDSGMTIFKDSCREDLGESLRKLIIFFSPDTVVWPGHNYGNWHSTTLEKEQKENKNSREYALDSVSFNPSEFNI